MDTGTDNERTMAVAIGRGIGSDEPGRHRATSRRVSAATSEGGSSRGTLAPPDATRRTDDAPSRPQRRRTAACRQRAGSGLRAEADGVGAVAAAVVR